MYLCGVSYFSSSFLILLIGAFLSLSLSPSLSLFYFLLLVMSLEKSLSVLFIFSKNQFLVSLICSIFLVSILFISALIFIISLLLLVLGFVHSSFSKTLHFYSILWFIRYSTYFDIRFSFKLQGRYYCLYFNRAEPGI